MTTQKDAVQEAVEILQRSPYHWQVTYEYPGYGLIVFGDGPDFGPDEYRGYAFGTANETVTVQKVGPDGDYAGDGADTGLRSDHADAFLMAIVVANAVVRLEDDMSFSATRRGPFRDADQRRQEGR